MVHSLPARGAKKLKAHEYIGTTPRIANYGAILSGQGVDVSAALRLPLTTDRSELTFCGSLP
jgi:hypothetical protein